MSKASPLSRERIAISAIAIADRDGFASVSMRRIAQDLGVGTMSIYHYVKNKADLIAAMDDAFMGEVLLPTLPKGWRAALTSIATRTRDVFLKHPWALSSMLSAPPGVNAMRHLEQCLRSLTETSFTAKEKLTLLAILDDFVFGYALREAANHAPVDLHFVKSQLATGDFPQLATVFRKGRGNAKPDRFQMGLGAVLDMAEGKARSAKLLLGMGRPSLGKR